MITSEQFIKKCEDSRKFNDWQISEIKNGFKNGLNIDQVVFYADPKFNNEQMYEIRWGFQKGLSIEQIEVYAKPEFNRWQMSAMYFGFANDLTIEQVKMYAKAEYDEIKMHKIRQFIEINKDIPNNTLKFMIGLNCT